MSSAADRVTFEKSVEGQDNSVLFQGKKYTFITDSSSTNGAFSGQIQFDLTTLSSQSQWTDLSEAVIQFPVKLSISNVDAKATAANTVGLLSATIKNGFHQFVSSVQVVIGGNTVQNSQNFTNIDTNFKILSTWSGDTVKKYGDTLGISLDDWLGTADTTNLVTSSLDNAALVTGVGGFNIARSGTNPGYKARQLMNNSNVATTTFGKSILSTNQSVLGKSNVQVGTSTTAGDDVFVAFLTGTIRLKDISDFCAKTPMAKNLKGYVYVNYNSSQHTVDCGTSTTVVTITNAPVYGNCAPALLNVIASTGGFVPVANTTSNVVLYKAEISAQTSALLTTAKPSMTNARLYVPYYVANPAVDRALTMKKTFRYNERFVTQFTMTASGQFSGTLTPGITNPQRLILYPYFTGADSAAQNSSFITNPLLSPVDGVPSTTSPFAAISALQIMCGNVPMFQQPVTYDFDNWLSEISEQGEEGGLDVLNSSGLLSQRQWNQLYRYYTCNLSRRLDSEDGCSKSIQVQCTNATLCPMTVIAIVWYQKEVEMDTASGFIEQKR